MKHPLSNLENRSCLWICRAKAAVDGLRMRSRSKEARLHNQTDWDNLDKQNRWTSGLAIQIESLIDPVVKRVVNVITVEASHAQPHGKFRILL